MTHRESIINTTRFRNTMLYLILTITCIVCATIIFFVFFDVCINYGFKKAIKTKYAIPVLIAGVIFVVCAFPIFNRYKRQIQSDAIDHYVVGDVELHEKTVDGQVVDWEYIVKPADYE